jgi:hypothetical protein
MMCDGFYEAFDEASSPGRNAAFAPIKTLPSRKPPPMPPPPRVVGKKRTLPFDQLLRSTLCTRETMAETRLKDLLEGIRESRQKHLHEQQQSSWKKQRYRKKQQLIAQETNQPTIQVLPPRNSTMPLTRRMRVHPEESRLVWKLNDADDEMESNKKLATAEGYTGASEIDQSLVEASCYIDDAVQMLKDMQRQYSTTPADVLTRINPEICKQLNEKYHPIRRREGFLSVSQS